MINHIKTVLLLASLSGLVLFFGYLFGGSGGLTIALIFAVVMNFGAFFFSHKLILFMYRAKPAPHKEFSHLHKIVEELSKKMGLPKPSVYIVPTATPNAFATGPSPRKAVVACTEGILKLLDDKELKGVIAHELSHIKNRDMLVTTIAATLGAVISYLAMMVRFAAIFGGSRDRDNGSIFGMLALAILAPLIALILQLAISRSREYLADEGAAKSLKDGHSLASALKKLDAVCKVYPMRGNSATSSLFIVNPFRAGAIVSLFSTHPSTVQRVERLEKMKF